MRRVIATCSRIKPPYQTLHSPSLPDRENAVVYFSITKGFLLFFQGQSFGVVRCRSMTSLYAVAAVYDVIVRITRSNRHLNYRRMHSTSHSYIFFDVSSLAIAERVSGIK